MCSSDLLGSVAESEWEDIYDAFLEHALLIFHGQHLTDAEQIAFAERFGPIEILVEGLKIIPLSNKSEAGKALGSDDHRTKLLKGNEGWHTDSSTCPYLQKPRYSLPACCPIMVVKQSGQI